MAKRIAATIWALWGLVAFIISLLIVILPICLTYLIKEPAGTRAFGNISKFWMSVYLPLIGCPLVIRGKQNFKKGETYIVVCNHSSLMDIPITTPFVPGANKTIAKMSFSKIPVFGWVYTRGSVLVDRSRDDSRRKSFEEMIATIRSGLHMVIYPEGTRNRTAQPLKSFHDGAFKLAKATQKKIIPAIIFNTAKVLPPGKLFYLWPQKLEIHFLNPVDEANLTPKELKESVYHLMWNYIESHNKRQEVIND